MIYTLTINPSVDRTIYVNNFEINKLNKAVDVLKDAGGKGINVSKTIKVLNGESIALGFVGGTKGLFIKEKLRLLNINCDFIEIEGNTRENIKIVDAGNLTEINEKGPYIKDEINILLNKIKTLLNEDDIIILSGSICPGVEKDIYRKIIEIAHQRKAKAIVDASGELLLETLKASPDIIKPNKEELLQIINHNTIEEKCLELIKSGVKEILLSMGKDGALYYSKEYKYIINPLNIEVKSTVGAGDAMVAALAISLVNNLNIEDKLKLAVASASAACLTSGTNPADISIVNELIKQVQLKKL